MRARLMSNGTNGNGSVVHPVGIDDVDFGRIAKEHHALSRFVTSDETTDRAREIEQTSYADQRLDDIVRVVRNAKRDKKTLDRIVRQYGISNDAGIGDTITADTVKVVRDIAKMI